MPAREQQTCNPNLKAPLKLHRWLAIPVIAMLAACGGSSTQKPQPDSTPEITEKQEVKLTAEDLLLLAQQSSFDQAQVYQLRAAEILAQEGKPDAALRLLAKIHAYRLPFSLQKRFVFLSAELSLGTGEGWQALIALNNTGNLIYDRLSPTEQMSLTAYRAHAYGILGYHEASAREYLLLARQQTGQPAQQAYEQLWQALLNITLNDIRSLMDSEKDDELRGWLDLARVRKEAANNLDQFNAELSRWLRHWSDHPGALALPRDMAFLVEISRNPVQHIAVFLPQSGPLARAGNAIRDGIVAAAVDARAQSAATPKLSFYDSNTMSLDELYRAAMAAGAEVAIGPLSKNKVTELQERGALALPTLALNYGTNAETENNQLFQYAISAEDEASQAAKTAWQDGKKRALTLTPASDWGGRALTAFETTWSEQGGTVAETAMYSGKTNLGLSIEKMLEVDKSERRWRRMSQILDQKIEFEPRRRQDIDMMFLVATPATARQVKPALAFYYAADLPVYATSHLYNGKASPSRDQDLNGINFCDIPWFLENDSSLKRQIDKAWPDETNRYGRLFAMGTDALQLAGRLRMLQALPDSKVYGATGALSMQGNQTIQRQLEWATFVRGRPVMRQYLVSPAAQSDG
ncbi:penicillin-binding protein activator [Oceanospirillum sanctuarii]|uniref:penicillin-binding protein activator n=1 Tax=Oceanospirillum sanctuarii TaxID=1434821 RepID=UPI000A395969|nr:penicillin-binding protein activator [Oceanospirillum sanctuarii]